MNKLINFTEQFIFEFEDFLTDDIYIKLNVLCWHYGKFPPNEIKKKIEELIKRKNISNGKKIIAPYMRSDNKKISRIPQSCRKIKDLPYFIGLNNLITIIIRKYPSPMLVGFPFFSWNGEHLLKYINLYFSLANGYNTNFKILTVKTIRNILCRIDSSSKKQDLTTLVKYYFSRKDDYDLYYIYMKNKKYKVSKADEKHQKRSERYNSTYLSTIFWLGDKSIGAYDERILNTSYNTRVEYICLNYIFRYFYALTNVKDNGAFKHGKEPIFLINANTQMKKKLLSLYYDDLETIPPYHFLIFGTSDSFLDTLSEISEEQSNISEIANKMILQYMDITEYEGLPAFKSKLKSRMEKEKYIKKMQNTISDL